MSGSVKGKNKSSPRQPLKALPALQEDEEDDARHDHKVATQKARIMAQMAVFADDARRKNARDREKDRDEVEAGRGLLNEDTENIKPIREVKRAPPTSKPSVGAYFNKHAVSSRILSSTL